MSSLVEMQERMLDEPFAKKRDDSAFNSGLTAAGATAATAGVAGGGIGLKADPDLFDAALKGKTKGLQRGKDLITAARGGIFGGRHATHDKMVNSPFGLYGDGGWKANREYYRDKPATRKQMFERGLHNGKIEPEDRVMRHLKRGQRISHGLAIGGGGLALYGAYRSRRSRRRGVSKSDDGRRERVYGSMIGVGATGAVLGEGANRLLLGQRKRWLAESKRANAEAKKIIPRLDATIRNSDMGGDGGKARAVADYALAGKSKDQAYRAGQLRGLAGQGNYFATAYKNNARAMRGIRTASLGVAVAGAAGAAGLHESRRRHPSETAALAADGSGYAAAAVMRARARHVVDGHRAYVSKRWKPFSGNAAVETLRRMREGVSGAKGNLVFHGTPSLDAAKSIKRSGLRPSGYGNLHMQEAGSRPPAIGAYVTRDPKGAAQYASTAERVGSEVASRGSGKKVGRLLAFAPKKNRTLIPGHKYGMPGQDVVDSAALGRPVHVQNVNRSTNDRLNGIRPELPAPMRPLSAPGELARRKSARASAGGGDWRARRSVSSPLSREPRHTFPTSFGF